MHILIGSSLTVYQHVHQQTCTECTYIRYLNKACTCNYNYSTACNIILVVETIYFRRYKIHSHLHIKHKYAIQVHQPGI